MSLITFTFSNHAFFATEQSFLSCHVILSRRRPHFWITLNGYISATAHSIHLYSTHRAVIFVTARLSCLYLPLN